MPAGTFRRDLRISYFAPFFAMALLAAIVLWRVNAQVASVGWVEHTDRVIRRTKDAQLDLREMAVAIRSYWLTSDKKYLIDLRNADQRLTATLAEISDLRADNPAQSKRLLEVSNVEGAWIGALRTLMSRPNLNPAAVIRLGQLDAQNQVASNLLDEIIDEEDRLRARRTGKEKIQNALIFLLVPSLCGLVAVVLSYWGLREIDGASRQFTRALARAEEANQAKDNFLATVSHELRNPLNSIILTANILIADRNLNEDSRQRARAIDRAARTQAQLIEDLLDVSRIESGRLRLDVQPTDLSQVVKSAVDSMRVAADAKSIALVDVIDTSIRPIAGDPKRLEQVVWNLVSNAIKFTPKGGKVQVRLQRVNSHVEIVVADNGQGIAPSSLPSVFDRFWQEPGRGARGLGLGLGLSIVKELIALHGGTVTAHSDGIGMGSTFIVRLPLPPASPRLEPVRHPPVGPTQEIAPRLDGLILLVVDDDTETCKALTNLLGSLGATVYAESSVQAALNLLDGNQPDAIIADVEMPVHDGFFFAREIRNREQTRRLSTRLPLLALTAYGRVEDRVKILASGFDGHMVKPVDLVELSATVRSLVGARAA